MGRASSRKRAVSRQERIAHRTHGSGPRERVVLLLAAFRAAGQAVAAHALGQPLDDVRLGGTSSYDPLDDLRAVDVSLPEQRAVIESRLTILATGLLVAEHAMARMGATAYREQLSQGALAQMQRLAGVLVGTVEPDDGARSLAEGQAVFDTATAAAEEVITTRWDQINAVALGLCGSPTGRLSSAEVAALVAGQPA